jgi:hypothetical protein
LTPIYYHILPIIAIDITPKLLILFLVKIANICQFGKKEKEDID